MSGSILGALQYRDYRLLWAGGLVTYVGTWMQVFAMGWLVVQLAVKDGHPELGPLYLGLVGLARAVPGVFFGLYSGVLADTVERRRLLGLGHVIGAVVSAVLTALTFSGHVSIVWVVVLGAMLSFTTAVDSPVRHAMTPLIVKPQHMLSAVSLQVSSWHISTILGPLIGGLLIIPLGVGGVFLIKAFSHLATVWALVLMAPQRLDRRPSGQSTVGAIRESLQFIRDEPMLRWVVLGLVAASILTRPYIDVLPAFAQGPLGVGPIELSWLVTAAGIGSFLGALAMAPIGSLPRPGVALFAAYAAGAAFTFAFSRQTSLVPALVFSLLLSFMLMLAQSLTTALMQLRAPDRLRGRTMSLNSVSYNGLMPVGTMVLGSVGTVAGIDAALAASGALMGLLAVAVLLVSSAIRRLGLHPEPLPLKAVRGRVDLSS